ncbi:GlsB/YeaQ/YmgE family stress response membrane protein [Lacrimispora sp. JR3]|uniref:GlsB/YeaQ/YmgE family stress response membrane protein n=1 Tax=Lacrimispora sinapis TaxID=3111456 RepID=UPI0037492BB3
MGIIGWIIIGALAGWLASMVTGNNKNMGALSNIVVGIIGGFIGGFVMNLLGGVGVTGFNLWSLLVAFIGSLICLWIFNKINNKN